MAELVIGPKEEATDIAFLNGYDVPFSVVLFIFMVLN